MTSRSAWSAEEVALLRQGLRSGRKVAVIASELGRSVSSVRGAITKYGLERKRQFPDLNEVIRECQPLQWTDGEIAADYERRYGLRVSRRSVSERRRKLGLPHNAFADQQRRRVAEKTRAQVAALGLESLAQVRSLAYRNFAARQGWPEDLRPRAVQILTLLYERGPMTRDELCAATGMPWKGSRHSLASNDPEGSYLAHLQARGLVIRLGRIVKRKGIGRSVYKYAIPPYIRRTIHVDQTSSSGAARD